MNNQIYYKNVLIWITMLVLFSGLLFTQFIWLQNSYKTKEIYLNHQASIITNNTVNAIKSDSLLKNKISYYAKTLQNSNENSTMLDYYTTNKINGIIKINIEREKLNLPFLFSINDYISQKSLLSIPIQKYMLETIARGCMDDVIDTNNFELHLYFPTKREYLYSQTFWLFYLAGIMILFIIFLFIFLVKNLVQQNKQMTFMVNFVNNMTHELKTPIANIQLANNLTRKEDLVRDNETINQYTTIIAKETTKLEKNVSKILETSMLDAGAFQYSFENVNLDSLIKNIINNIYIGNNKIYPKIIANLNTGLFSIRADRFHLTNTIMNLIDNAIKYSKYQPIITISTKEKNKFMYLTIQDNGIGMKKDDLKKIFTKFYRVNTGNIQNVKGFGIGLYYVKTIILAHKGEIKAESELGVGSKIIIKLKCNENNG